VRRSKLRVALPVAIRDASAMSGMGKMWREVLRGLEQRADVRFAEPTRTRGWRRPRTDVWLSDCGLGVLDVDAPLVVQVHEAGWDDESVRATLDPEFLEVVLEGRVGSAVRAAARIITPSESARDQVARHWDIPRDHIHAVPHGVDPEFFHPDRTGGAEVVARGGGRADLPYVLFVSQIHPRKNVGALREAMAELAQSGLPHQLVLVGSAAQDRPDSARLDAEARADLPGAPGRVVLLRDIPEDDVAALMAGAAAFCLPSLMEGFGMTALEAMSSGVPVVVSDRGSLPEVVSDAGLVVPPTAGAIRDALARVLTDDALARDLSARGRARALTFNWSRTVDDWFDVLRLATRDRVA